MQYTKEQRQRQWHYIWVRFAIFALTIVFFFLMFRMGDIFAQIRRFLSILRPFIWGGVMAYMLRIPCNFFEMYLEKWLPGRLKKAKTGLAILISLLLISLLVFLFVREVIPQLVTSIDLLTKMAPDAVTNATRWVQEKLSGYPAAENYLITVINEIYPKLLNWAETDLLPLLQNMAGGVVTTVTTIVGYLFNLVIGFIVCIYALASRKKFAKQGKAVLYSILKPKWADSILEEARFADKMFMGFFGGRILDSAIIGVICYIVSLILGFPNAMLISVIVGVTNVIPYFGPWIGAVPSALLILIVDPVKCIWFVIFVIILQTFDGNILGPKLLANSTGLSSFWVLFSITLFSGLFGFVGILIGVPVFAVIYDLLTKLVVSGLKRHDKLELLQDVDPVTGQEEAKDRGMDTEIDVERVESKDAGNRNAEEVQVSDSDRDRE